MIIDDEELVSEVIEAHVADHGYEGRSFGRPDEALSYFEKNFQNVDVAIIDLTLPGIGGAELAQKFFEIKPDLCTILVTGYPPESIPADQKQQFHRIIFKPFARTDIIEAIDSIMGKFCKVTDAS